MADVLDILTEAEARAAVNVTTGHDLELAVMVTGVSRRIDDLCGPVVVRTITDERHDADGPVLFLRRWPVLSVTTVTEYLSGTGTVITAESLDTAGGYLLENGMLSRRSGWASSSWNGRITVTYQAGRYADTASVDALFKTAAASVLRRLWKRESGTWAQSPSWIENTDAAAPSGGFYKTVDPMVNELLGAELLPPSVA